MNIELATVRLICERPLKPREAPLLRGFFGRQYPKRPEFHHHTPQGLLYRHPLIQYKVVGGVGRVAGLGVGSFLLQAIDLPDQLLMNRETVQVLEAQRDTEIVDIGPTTGPLYYRFVTPWLPLNEGNYLRYREMYAEEQRRSLLNRVLVGNLLSLCKSVGLTVEDRLSVQVYIEKTEQIEIKQGVPLAGVRGTFRVNFRLPELWGIGKQSARGFGVVHIIEE